MSKRYYVDALDDTDAETYALLASRYSKLAMPAEHDIHTRGRKASNDSEYHERVRKIGKIRQRDWPESIY